MNLFDKHIKSSLENYEVDYNPSHWEDMNRRLNKLSPKKSSTGKLIGIAAGISVMIVLLYFLSSRPNNNNSVKEKKQSTVITENSKSVFTEQKTKSETTHSFAHENVVNSESENNSDKTGAQKTYSEKSLKQYKNSSKTESKEQKAIAENTTSVQSINENKETKHEPSSAPTSILPDATFRFNQTLVCAGTAVQFIHENAVVPCTYRWDFGDGKTSAEKSPDHTYIKPGTYVVKLKVTSIKDKISDEKQQTIVVHPVPSVEIDFKLTDYNPSEVNFEARGNNITEYLWNFDDRHTSTEKNPVHSYTKTGTYKVMVLAKNSFGCSASDSRIVTIESLFPLAPNSFSPNGDGKNDTWMPASFAYGDYNFTLTVFDRNGNSVFTSSNKNDAWDGANAKTGDVFIWKATVKDKNGKIAHYNGTITIIE